MTPVTEHNNFERVALRIDPQSKLLRTWSLHGGSSAHMMGVEVLLADGNPHKMIVRRPGAATLRHNPDAAADEFKLLQQLKSGGLPVPTPYDFDQSGDILPTPYLVIEYVEGQPEFAPANITDFIYQLATNLAFIHRVNGTNLDLSFLPVQTKSLGERIEERLAAIEHPQYAIRMDRILEIAHTLPQLNRPVLLHGDFWPGNILWREGQLMAIIDWEDAELGDPLSDFAISRLDTLLIFGIEALNDFTWQYQSLSGADFTFLPYWDVYAALRAAPHLAEWPAIYPQFGRSGITEETMRARHQWFINQALEKLSAH